MIAIRTFVDQYNGDPSNVPEKKRLECAQKNKLVTRIETLQVVMLAPTAPAGADYQTSKTFCAIDVEDPRPTSSSSLVTLTEAVLRTTRAVSTTPIPPGLATFSTPTTVQSVASPVARAGSVELSFHHVSVSADRVQLLKNIRGHVKPGEILAVMGPSGMYSNFTTIILVEERQNIIFFIQTSYHLVD